MAANIREYLQELAQTSNLDAASLGVVMKALDSNPKFAEGLGQGFSRQSEFSRAMDELRTQQTQVESVGKQQKDWWDKTQPAVQAAIERAKAYETKFGPIEGDGNGNGNGTGLSKAEVEKMLKENAERGMQFTANVSKQMGYVLQDYAVKFPGKVLDLEAIEKKALESNMTIRQAYEATIAPDLEAKSKADHEAALKTAREEGAREVMSKHHIPIDSAPAEQAPFFRQPVEGDKALNDGQRARNFAETWNTEAGKGATL